MTPATIDYSDGNNPSVAFDKPSHVFFEEVVRVRCGHADVVASIPLDTDLSARRSNDAAAIDDTSWNSDVSHTAFKFLYFAWLGEVIKSFQLEDIAIPFI